MARNTPPGEGVPIDIFAENHDGLREAIKLIGECFEHDEDSLDSDPDSASASASDSDAEDSSFERRSRPAAETKPPLPQSVKETYVVAADMVHMLMPRVMAAVAEESVSSVDQFGHVTKCPENMTCRLLSCMWRGRLGSEAFEGLLLC